MQEEMVFSRNYKGSGIAALWNVPGHQEEINVSAIEQWYWCG